MCSVVFLNKYIIIFNEMKIVIKTKNFKLSRTIRDFIEEKIGSLEKFSEIFQKRYFDKFFGKGKPTVEAWLEIGKTTLHHQKGPFFRAECQMRFPGKSLRITARSHDLRLAITEVKDELQRQLKQYKNKLTAKSLRRQRRFKKSLRLHPLAKFKKSLQPSRRSRGIRIREEGL
jgi:ribosomal subunit interface protein